MMTMNKIDTEVKVGKRLAPITNTRSQNQKILNRTREANPDNQPNQSRHVAKLHRQNRSDQRSGPADGRKMMAE
jgi:hypothetical protein